MSFVEAGLQELPKWLNGPQARGYIAALREAQDGESFNLSYAMRQRYPTTCADDALDTVGVGFLIERFPGETFATYRARLLAAWDTWAAAGTRKAILDSLHAYGVEDVEVYESTGDGLPSDPVAPATPDVPGITPRGRFGAGSWYSRFWVMLGPAMPWTPMQMPFVCVPGVTTLGSSATPQEVSAVRRQILKWKSPHGYPMKVILNFGAGALFGITTTAPFAAGGDAPCQWYVGRSALGDTLGNMPFKAGGYYA